MTIRQSLLIVGFFLALPIVALAQNPVTYYQIDPRPDHVAGAPDFSYLNHPLTPADRIFTRHGHFYRVGPDLQPNTADDERVKFWGVNLAFTGNFPDFGDAPRIARRLRRLGVNLVRLHHMDTSPDGGATGNSLLTTGPYPTLHQTAVARLRNFLDAFKAEGIHVNLNLKVGYVFRPGPDNVPALPAGIAWPSQSKPLHMIHPRLIELQKDYARQVIDALQLNNDPVLAMVEINNESSLIYEWQTNALDDSVQGEYRDELHRRWNEYLKAKYPTTEALRAAWGGESSDGPQLLSVSGMPQGPLSGWVMELHGGAQASFAMIVTDGLPTARVSVTSGGNWVIFKQTGYSIEMTDDPYLAEVEMRAEVADGVAKGVYFDLKRDVSPWDTQASRTVTVTNQWQKFAIGFIPKFAMNGVGRFAVQLENFVGTNVYVRNWTLRRVARKGLAAGQSLEAANIALLGSAETATAARTDDYGQFLVERDRHYLNQMLGAVREKIPSLVPVAGTQMDFGGLMNLDSHRDLDYVDSHYYVDHYGFPNVAWDSRDWYVRNQSHVGDGLWALQEIAIKREAERPYTVSEFNQPWPNIHAPEHDPVIAAVAALQDWDGLMHFAYSHSRDWDGGVPSGFDIKADWGKWATFGQAAWLYRTGALDAANLSVEIPLDHDLRLRALREKRNWEVRNWLQSTIGYHPMLPFVSQVKLARAEDRSIPEAAKQRLTNPYRADTQEFTYDRTNQRFLLHAAKAAGVIGFFTQKVAAGAIEVEPGAANARGFATVLLTALDDQPLPNSRRMLLSTPGYTLRSQPGVSPPRPQQIVKYPGRSDWFTVEPDSSKPSGNLSGGNIPNWMERVETYVTLRTNARQITVYPLDGAGGRLAALPGGEIERVTGGFRIHLQGDNPQAALSFWYEIVTDSPSNGAHSSAATYRAERLTPNMIVAAFGQGLAETTAANSSSPLPTVLEGVSVKVTDSEGTERLAPLFFVSPNQVNYLMPAETAYGAATISIVNRGTEASRRTAQIGPLAPGIFSANATGNGVAAALVFRVKADGTSAYEPLTLYDEAQKKYVSLPIDLGKDGEQVYLLLFGTGLRHRANLEDVTVLVGNSAMPVTYAGAHGDLLGLDQVNVLLIHNLAGRGETPVQLGVNGKWANTVTITIK